MDLEETFAMDMEKLQELMAGSKGPLMEFYVHVIAAKFMLVQKGINLGDSLQPTLENIRRSKTV